jgi:hypothetical protein
MSGLSQKTIAASGERFDAATLPSVDAGDAAGKLTRVASLAHELGSGRVAEEAVGLAERLAEGRFYVGLPRAVQTGQVHAAERSCGGPGFADRSDSDYDGANGAALRKNATCARPLSGRELDGHRTGRADAIRFGRAQSGKCPIKEKISHRPHEYPKSDILFATILKPYYDESRRNDTLSRFSL